MRYSITKKAVRIFLLLIFLMIAIGTISVIQMDLMQNNNMELIKDSKKGVTLFKFQSEVGILLQAVKDYIITKDKKFYETYKKLDAKVESTFDELESLMAKPDEKESLAEIGKKMNDIKDAVSKLVKIDGENSDESVALLLEIIDFEFGSGIGGDISKRVEQFQSRAQAVNLRAQKESEDAFFLITVVIVSTIGLSIVVVIFILKRISKPILTLVRIAQRIASRDFKVNIKAESKDEIGMLIEAFNAMAEEIGKRYEELENFSNIAAHDLKSPLTSVLGSAQLLLEDLEGKLSEDEEILLKNILSTGKNMNSLISDLLNFAKAGKVEFSEEPVSMSSMLNEIQNNFSYIIKEKNVKLEIQETLPAFICDPARFSQVWGNLISNAIKYNDNPEPRIEIGTIENRKKSNEYCFYVRDNGIGIDDKFLNKIFNSFQRATTDRKYAGTGIGLAIVKRIIDFHNGKVWVESEKNVGSTFYFTIPELLVLGK